MHLTETKKTYLIRFLIGLLFVMTIAIYYFSEQQPFEYDEYEIDISELKRFDAVLNESVAQTRFGIIQNYDPINAALKGMHSSLKTVQETVARHPNPAIQREMVALENAIHQKLSLVDHFKRINPIQKNAIMQFSSIMYEITDNQANDNIVESCLEKDLHYQINDKINDLFRNMLIYIHYKTETRREHIKKLVSDIESMIEAFKENPKELRNPDMNLNRLAQGLSYAKKILELQPQITAFDTVFYEIPITDLITDVEGAYKAAFVAYLKRSRTYHVFLYLLLFALLAALRALFGRLRKTVNNLHIEVERKVQAEKALAKTNKQLEKRVTERTQELTLKNKHLNKALDHLKEAQDQLITQEKMASIGMLTTGIAHEIKNPLNFVTNFSDLSIELLSELKAAVQKRESADSDLQKKNIEEIIDHLSVNCTKIKEHGVRADNIVKSMLLVSDTEGTQKEWFDLKSLMENSLHIALESFQSQTGKIEVTIERHYPEAPVDIYASPHSIGRAFLYLFNNALYALFKKQSESQGPYTPTLTLQITPAKTSIGVIVKDNGIGISSEQLGKIFEPFFTTKPTGGGNTGLGLSICYATIVKQHKGQLTVSSQEGSYTQFTVTLPIPLKEATSS